MIIDLERTATHIANWIKAYLQQAVAKTQILGLSGGIDSALVALLCQRTGFPLVCINLPCQSNVWAWERSEAFSKEFKVPLVKIDLAPAFEAIHGQVITQGVPKDSQVLPYFPQTKETMGGLRSCLRSPVLSCYAHASNGLIIGTGNRSEDHLIRYFQKYGDGNVDISPISELFKSEVRELFAYLTKRNGEIMPSAKAILDAPPSADLWGKNENQNDETELQMTYDEIEWADREDDKNNIVVSDDDPAKNPSWTGYTGPQRKVVARMHALEKSSRHKINSNLPVCSIRNIDGLVR